MFLKKRLGISSHNEKSYGFNQEGEDEDTELQKDH
jgi:hypothetical protein